MAVENLPILLLLCLVLWLIHNDHRHNPKEGRRRLLRRAFRALRAEQLRRPVQKRLRWQAMAPMMVMAAAGILGVAVLLVGCLLYTAEMGQQPDGPTLIGVAENQPEQAYRHCQKANLRPNIYRFGGNGRLRPPPVLPEAAGQHQ